MADNEKGVKLFEEDESVSTAKDAGGDPGEQAPSTPGKKKKSLSIMARTMLSSMVIIAIFSGLFFGWIFPRFQENVYLDKYDRLLFLTETTYDVVEYYAEKERAGDMSRRRAQERAADVLREIRYDGGNYFWVINKEPRTIMHPIEPELEGRDMSTVQDENGKRFFLEFVNVCNEAGEGFVEYMWPRPGSDVPVPKLAFVRELPDWEWIIGTGIYMDDIEEEIAFTYRIVFIVVVLIILISVLLSYISSKLIADGFRRLSEAASRVASGDLTCEIEYSGNDEVAQLVESFNMMIRNLKQIARQIDSGVLMMTSHSSQILKNSQENSARLSEQAAAITQITAAVEELSATSKQISSGAELIEGMSKETLDTASTGVDAVKRTVEGVHEISEKTSEASDRVVSLGAKSQEIGGAVRMINDIADRTKLIAFNAAIEAAGAGEAGKRFSVVAVEVRSLADNVVESTREIKRIIQQIQDTTNSSLMATEQGARKVDEGIELADDAMRKMDRIVEHMREASEAATRISQSTQHQETASEQVVTSVRELLQMTQQSVNEAHQSREASEQLNDLARKLEETVAGLKTD